MNIAIVGGGIGGLATANALLKKGFNVQVYERANALPSTETGLTLTPSGLNCLNAIQPGIAELLIDAGSPLHTLTLKLNTGETISSMPISLIQDYRQPMLNIRWSSLQSILASALPPEIIHLQHFCLGFEQSDSKVRLFFPDRIITEIDLLIGADGINSTVRQTLINDGGPNYTGRLCWGAVVQFEHRQLSPNTSTLYTAAEGKNFLLVDVGGGYTFWSANAISTYRSGCQSATTPKARALEQFADWAEPVGAIIAATPDLNIVERPICERLPLRSWSQGRVTLLGDAAHPAIPLLGQGANMAIEDAYELAECLAIVSDLETALKAYEDIRIPPTTTIYDRSSTEGHCSYQPNVRTAIVEMMKLSQMSQDDFTAWLYSYNPLPIEL